MAMGPNDPIRTLAAGGASQHTAAVSTPRRPPTSTGPRPPELGPADVPQDDIEAMMASRPMTEADLTTADVAAQRALAGVLAGDPHVLTHGDLAEAVALHHAEMERALARLSELHVQG